MRRFSPASLALLLALLPNGLAAEEDPDSFDALLKAVQCLDDPECRARSEQERREREAAEARAREAAAKMRDDAARALGREPKTIQLGDDTEYVRLQWGEPVKIDRMVSGYGVHEWWWYGGSNAVHFADGLVDSIHTGESQ